MRALTRAISTTLAFLLAAQSLCYAGDRSSLSRQKDLQPQVETAEAGGEFIDQSIHGSGQAALDQSSVSISDQGKGNSQSSLPKDIHASSPEPVESGHGRLIAAARPKQSQGRVLPPLPPEEPLPPTDLPLSKVTLEVAKDIGVLSQLESLDRLKRKYLDAPGENQHVDILAVRQEIDEVVLSTALDVSSTVAQLDTQISQSDALADFLEAKRDKSLRNNNIFNFSSGGVMQSLGSSVQIGTPNALQNAGNEIEVVQAAFQFLVSMYALKLAQGKNRSSGRSNNMLASVVGREAVDYEKYAPSVWAYLNDTPSGSNLTRREALIKRWVELGRIQPLNKKGSKAELDGLSGTIDLPKSVSIDLLRNRIPMMEDIRAVVSSMSRALHEIMVYVRRR